MDRGRRRNLRGKLNPEQEGVASSLKRGKLSETRWTTRSRVRRGDGNDVQKVIDQRESFEQIKALRQRNAPRHPMMRESCERSSASARTSHAPAVAEGGRRRARSSRDPPYRRPSMFPGISQRTDGKQAAAEIPTTFSLRKEAAFAPKVCRKKSGRHDAHGRVETQPQHITIPKRVEEPGHRAAYLEHKAMKVVQGREDVLERLAICAEKLDDTARSNGGWVSRNDPIVRLFYRLVSSLRERTVETVEAVSAYQKATSSTSPFVYNGGAYFQKMGPDLQFLEEVEYVRARMGPHRPVDDPFLKRLTPTGIPIDDISDVDLQRGGKMNAAALRMRMALKTMEKQGVVHIHTRAEHMENRNLEITPVPPVKNCQFRRAEGSPRYHRLIVKSKGKSMFQIVEACVVTIQRYARGWKSRKRALQIKDERDRSRHDNDDAIDVVIDCLISSLDCPHDFEIQPFTFTVHRWLERVLMASKSQKDGMRESGVDERIDPSGEGCMSSKGSVNEGDVIDDIIDCVVSSLDRTQINKIPSFTFTLAGWESDKIAQ